MAIRIPIITDLQDQGIKNAKIAFGNFKTAVQNAEGGLGKFKAGATSIMDSVGANAGAFAAVGAIAFGKFVGDGISAFQTVALEAGKFSDATGIEIEKASRYLEAAGDIGIPIDAIEGAIGRLNRTIGADPDKVRNLGVDLVYLKDGSLDVNETFKNTIDRIKGIKDPAEKARVASQLLGKGWQSMAELIAGGSAKFEASLAKVGDAKVISPDELQRAKDYRAAMDNLGDSVDELKIKAGEKSLPIVTFLANAAGWVLDFDTAFNNFFKGTDPVVEMNEKIKTFNERVRDGKEETKLLKDEIKIARTEAFNPFKESVDNVVVALVNAKTAWENLTGTLDREVSLDDAKTKLDELQIAATTAFGTGSQKDIDDYEAKLATFAGVLAGISGTMDGISSKEILFKFKAEGPAAALAYANYLARGAEYGGVSSYDALTLAGISGGARASGGPVMGGKSYLVGERGPELFTPGVSGGITPNNALGGGNTINVTVNGGDPNQVVAAIQRWVRDNGAVPMTTTSAIRR